LSALDWRCVLNLGSETDRRQADIFQESFHVFCLLRPVRRTRPCR
jgi:hypothetical protein